AAPGGDFLGVTIDFVESPCSRSSLIIPACQTGNFFLFVVGTSQAAPHVSGLGAFIDSQSGGSLDGEDLKEIIEETTDKVPGTDVTHGEGRINVFKALTGDDDDDGNE
ncbi:MAG: S8 family serine peptidase, partial [bacterium]